jgi:hypothetical protein
MTCLRQPIKSPQSLQRARASYSEILLISLVGFQPEYTLGYLSLERYRPMMKVSLGLGVYDRHAPL